MTRTITRTLAPVVEALERAQPVVVTTGELREIIGQADVGTPPHVVIQRLAKHGWLLDTGVRGAWEFVPGAHAGPYPHGDPFLTLRAQLAVTSHLPVRVSLRSALWAAGVADRAPSTHELSVPSRNHVPVALGRTFRVVRFGPTLPAEDRGGLPVDAPATMLMHLAESPADVRSWGQILNLLPAVVSRVDPDALRREASGRTHAAKVRLAYLLDGMAPALVEVLRVKPGSKVWFGPRAKLRRHDAKWNVADTVLPRHPATTGERAA